MTSQRKENYGKINREKVLGFTWDNKEYFGYEGDSLACLLYTSPSPRDRQKSRMPSSA